MKKNTAQLELAFVANAKSLLDTINKSKDALDNLQLNPKIHEEFKRQFDNMMRNVKKTLDANEIGFTSQAGIDREQKRIKQIGIDFANVISRIRGMNINIEDIFPDTKEYKDQFKEVEKAAKEHQKKMEEIENRTTKIEGHGSYIKGLKKASKKEEDPDSEIEALKKSELAKLYSANKGTYSKLNNARKSYNSANSSDLSMESFFNQVDSDFAEYDKLDKTAKTKWTKSKGGKSNYDIVELHKTVEAYREYLQIRNQIQDAADIFKGDAEEAQNLLQELNNVNKELARIASPTQNDAADALDTLYTAENQVNGATKNLGEGLDKTSKDLQNINEKAQKANELKSYFTQFFSATAIVMKLGQAVRNAITDFKDLDKQLNEISIVTGKSMEELWQGFSKLNSTAQKYGVVTSDVVSVQKLYYQQGRSVAEVNELTGETLTFAKISGLEFREATEYMTAALNAYKIEARDANVVTDTYAALSMEAAVDANELAVAMSKVASLAALSGAELQDTSAYLTKIIETTREAPETAGTALKTVIARFTAVNKLTADQKELLDEDYNFNNIEKALKTIGISVKDSAGQMREFSEIIGELGPKWESLDSNTKHYIATQAAGARQQSRFIALMDDWGRTEELMDVAADSAGTGAEQLALSMDSIDTKLNQLKASWQSFYANFLSSEMIKFAIDFARVIVDGIGSITGMLGTLNDTLPVWLDWLTVLIGAAIIGMASIIAKGAIKVGKTFGESFMKGYKAVKEPADATSAAKEIKDAFETGVAIGKAKALGEQKGKAEVEGITDAVEAADAAKDALVQSAAASAATEAGKTVAGVGTKLGGIAGGLASKLGSIISTAMPIILGVLVAAASVAAIVAIVKAVDDAKENEAATEVSSSNKEIDNEIKKTSVLTKNYTRALKLHNKGLAKTTEETEEYQKLLSEINEVYPQMVTKTEDGIYELVDASEELYDKASKSSEATIRAAQKRIGENAQLAAGAGIYVGEEAKDLNEELKSVASLLSEQSKDQIMTLANSDYKVKVDDITKMTEQGLTREAINEFVASDYSTKEFKNLMNDYMKLYKDSEGKVDVNALGYRNKEALTWFNALNAQYGGDLVQKLWESTFGENVMKAHITNWEDFEEAKTGEKIPEEMKDYVKEAAEREREEYIKKEYNNQYEKNLAQLLEESGVTRASIGATIEMDTDEEGNQYYTIPGVDKKYNTFEEAYQDYIISFKQEAKRMTDEWAQSYTGEDIVADYRRKMSAYLGLNDKTQQSYEHMSKLIAEGAIGAEENVEAFVDSFGLVNEELNSFLKDLLNNIKKNRTEEANKTFGRIEDLTGVKYNTKDFADYTNAQLSQMADMAQNTYELYGQDAAKGMVDQYKIYYDNVLKGNERLKNSFANVDFFDTKSIAKYGAEVLKYADQSKEAWTGFTTLINNASSATDRATRDVGTLFKESAEEVKKLTESFDDIESAIKGDLDMADAFDLVSNYGDIIGLEDLIPTGEGFKLNVEDATELAGQMLQMKVNELRVEEAMYKLKQLGLQREMETIVGTDEWESQYKEMIQQYKDLVEKMSKDPGNWTEADGMDLAQKREVLGQAGLLTLAEEDMALSESLIGVRSIIEAMGEMTIRVNDGIQETISRLEGLEDMLRKIGEYTDVDGYTQYLEFIKGQSEFTREFSTNQTAIIEATKDQFDALNNLIAASIAKVNNATDNLNFMQTSLLEQYGEYISFDEHGNILTNEEAMAQWATDISEIDTSTQAGKDRYDNEKQLYDLMLTRIQDYKDEQKNLQDATEAANDYLKQIQDLNKELQESVVEMEDAFIELFIKRDEEALESTRKRYEEMQKMDNDYLDSVRDAIEKERQLRERNEESEDLAKMEKQLELMRMSGGSVTEIQNLEQEIAKKRRDMADKRQDDAIKELEETKENREKEMNEELEFQEKTLEEKKKNMILYNQEVALLMQQDKETIMNTWKALDSEFQTSTETNKALLESQMEQMVASGLSAKELLADNYIKAIEDAYLDVKDANELNTDTFEEYVEVVSEEGGTNGRTVQNIKEIETAYIGVHSIIKKIVDLTPKINSALSEAAQYVRLISSTEALSIPLLDALRKIQDDDDEGNTPHETTISYKYDPDTYNLTHSYSVRGKGAGGEGTADLQDFIERSVDANGMTHLELTGKGGKIGNVAIFQIKDTMNKDTIAISFEDVKKLLGFEGSLEDFISAYGPFNPWGDLTAFATGGMVDFTGPAWVDGTKSKPEAFLSANDTKLIASLRDVLRTNPKFGSMAATSIQKNGDTYYEIHINVDELGDGYSVDDLMNELEERIVQVTDKNTVIKVG